MMFADGSKLYVHKELEDFEAFYSMYELVEKEDLPTVLHFRIATSGLKDLENCHPFLVTPNLGFVHNGIISKLGYDKLKSDTNIFRDMLQEAKLEDIPKEGFFNLIEGVVGTWNKMIFLNALGEHCIINEKQGTWDEGVWYSNTGYKPYVYQNSGTNYGINEWYGGGWRARKNEQTTLQLPVCNVENKGRRIIGVEDIPPTIDRRLKWTVGDQLKFHTLCEECLTVDQLTEITAETHKGIERVFVCSECLKEL